METVIEQDNKIEVKCEDSISSKVRRKTKVRKITINQKTIFVEKKVKQTKVAKVKVIKVAKFTPTKQEVRIKELESCFAAINREIEDTTNESDKKLYKTVLKEVKNSIYQLRNQ